MASFRMYRVHVSNGILAELLYLLREEITVTANSAVPLHKIDASYF